MDHNNNTQEHHNAGTFNNIVEILMVHARCDRDIIINTLGKTTDKGKDNKGPNREWYEQYNMYDNNNHNNIINNNTTHVNNT